MIASRVLILVVLTLNWNLCVTQGQGNFKHLYTVNFYRYPCGGSIINSNWVLTSARCVYSPPERRRVVEVGAQPGDDNSKYYDVTSVIVHERYRLNDPNNDIALLVVNRTIPLSDKIRPVALPPIGSTVPDNNGRFVSFRRPGNSQKLQEFSVEYVNATVCKEMYGSIFNITEDMFCAGLSAGVGQTCQVTPGMPLVGYSQNAPSTPVLYGITSFGVGSVMEGFPGLYVNVAAFRPWIDAKLRENGY